MNPFSEDCTTDSDDDTYIGDPTLEEIKRHILGNKSRHTLSCNIKEFDNSHDTSVKIIEVHSTPDILSYDDETIPQVTKQVNSDPDLFMQGNETTMNLRDSFVNMEKLASELVLSPRQKHNTKIPLIRTESVECDSDGAHKKPQENLQHEFNLQDHLKPVTPTKQEIKNIKVTEESETTLARTPESVTKENSPKFKTPGKPTSQKKNITTTPKSQIKYQDVVSPVAYYIKKNPLPSLVTNVRPNKPLASSSIPKLIKPSPGTSKGNKENANIPQVAYKSAKEMKMINVLNEPKIPHNQWSNQVTSSIPRAVVIKHKYRVNNSTNREKKCDAGLNNVTLKQADLSLCTQKYA